jgi:hypothetical protein
MDRMRILLTPKQSVTDGQFEKLGQLYRLVAGIADGLGSENTDSGQVLLVAQLSFAQARLRLFPAGYLYVPLSASKFRRDFGSVSGVAPLLSFASAYKPEFGLCGAADRFHNDRSDRGDFWVCAFLSSRRALGSNMLIRFERVET